uniref:Uncharacterized protein n=1 Tax=Timema genevievae TaxID=629358 RepID=A0A7R9KBY0_TIMGE|nr:unnamed protein product [Timema genevievae]
MSAMFLPECLMSAMFLPECVMSAMFLPECVMSAMFLPECVMSAMVLPECVMSAMVLPECVMSAMVLPESIISALFVPADRFGVRHVQAILLFGCLTVAYTLRVNLSVAIVSMTDRNGSNPNFKEYEWNTQTRSTILSSFFWGYVVMQVPAGMLGQRFGPKLFLMGAMAVCSVFNMLTPLAASWGGWGLVCACRIIQGLSQSCQDDKMGTPARIFPKLVDGGGIPSFNNAVRRSP